MSLMVAEAMRVYQGIDPEKDIFTHAGVKMLHPEPYSGEADLEQFEIFVTGIL